MDAEIFSLGDSFENDEFSLGDLSIEDDKNGDFSLGEQKIEEHRNNETDLSDLQKVYDILRIKDTDPKKIKTGKISLSMMQEFLFY